MEKAAGATLRPSSHALIALAFAFPLGCAPNVNVVGVYFPGWLVSTVVGLVASYLVVGWLGRSESRSALAQSGLFFCSLTVVFASILWWILFRAF
jgi:uncharacterized membrane protein